MFYKPFTIRIQGRFDTKMAELFEKQLKNTKPTEDGWLFLSIYSKGGNLGAMYTMVNAMQQKQKEGVKFCALIVWAESAALLLTLYTNYVICTDNSKGAIHLPVKSSDYDGEIQEIEYTTYRKNYAMFISNNTNLSEEEVYSLDNVLLLPTQMLKYNLVQKIYKSFDELYTQNDS